MSTKKKKKTKRKITVLLQPAVKAGIRCVQAYSRDEEQTTQPKCLQLPQERWALAAKGFSIWRIGIYV